ncbi:hypothetical protein [Photorhabdus australis]|uniref:hypothetical protein n=1 Tax=Photorhabdus australis TaxID=286156 RepID=UPI0012FF3A47|nr:hypothetical protein [Photorhabdus australis]
MKSNSNQKNATFHERVANASKTSISVWTGLYHPAGVYKAFPDSNIIVYLRVWGI